MQERNLCSQGKQTVNTVHVYHKITSVTQPDLHRLCEPMSVILQTIKNQLKNVSKIVGNLKVSRQEEIHLLKHPEGNTIANKCNTRAHDGST